jgi:nitric oxide reductase NorE protein
MEARPIPTTIPGPAGGRNGAAPDDAPPQRRHVPGEPGLWVLLLGEMTVFAVLFGVFMHSRNEQPALYAQQQLELHRNFGGINTLLLLTSSLAVVIGLHAIRRQLPRLARASIAAAMLCGAAFLANKYLEWSSLLNHHHNPHGDNFFLYFFVLTGLHAFHVLIGMGVLTAVLMLARKPLLSKTQSAFVEGGTCFWHMVDLLWVVLFALLYLVH